MQTEDTNLLPENVEITVLNKQIFTIYPEGEFLFDLFSCRGSASVIYADSMANLLQPKDKQLDIVKMPGQTHATKVSRYSMILVQVTGNMSTVRWFPIRQDREQGVGYMVYDAGDIKYDSAFNRIDLTIEAVKKVQETKTIITNIKYTFFVSNKL